jgi:hypothetical protein
METDFKIQERIDYFLSQLSAMTKVGDIRDLCKKEMAFLNDYSSERTEENYTKQTIKKHLSAYRNGIRDLQKHGKLTPKRAKTALGALKQDIEISAKMRQEYAEKIKSYREQSIILKSSQIPIFKTKALKHLESGTLAKSMMGLHLATGRRGYEICKTANFHSLDDVDAAIKSAKKLTIDGKKLPDSLIATREEILQQAKFLNVDNSNCLVFSGQAKTKVKQIGKGDSCLFVGLKQPFVIPVLAPVSAILSAFEWLRANYQEFAEMSQPEIDDRIATLLNSNTTGVKAPSAYGAMFPSEHCTFKLLRKLYAAIVVYELAQTNDYAPAKLYSTILGHSNPGTMESYDYIRFR